MISQLLSAETSAPRSPGTPAPAPRFPLDRSNVLDAARDVLARVASPPEGSSATARWAPLRANINRRGVFKIHCKDGRRAKASSNSRLPGDVHFLLRGQRKLPPRAGARGGLAARARRRGVVEPAQAAAREPLSRDAARLARPGAAKRHGAFKLQTLCAQREAGVSCRNFGDVRGAVTAGPAVRRFSSAWRSPRATPRRPRGASTTRPPRPRGASTTRPTRPQKPSTRPPRRGP